MLRFSKAFMLGQYVIQSLASMFQWRGPPHVFLKLVWVDVPVAGVSRYEFKQPISFVYNI